MSPQPPRRPAARLTAALLLLATTSVAGCSHLGFDRGVQTARAGDTPDYATASVRPSQASVQTGVAAWDGDVSAPGKTAAHPTLAVNSWARVTNARTGQSAVVRITRRLAGARDRDIELSRDAAIDVGALHEGFATVLIEPIDPRQTTADEKLWTQPTPPRRAAATPAQVETLAYDRRPAPRAGYNPNIATASVPRSPAPGVDLADLGATTATPRYLQVGSFRDAGNAHRALAKMQSDGLTSGAYGDGFIQTAYVDGAVFHRVRLGPIESPQLAERALTDAKARGHASARILKP